MSFEPDTLIEDRYRLIECLGSGAMGEVWKAQDVRFVTRHVAIKLLREDQTFLDDSRNRARFLRILAQEARSGDGVTLHLIVNTLDDLLVAGDNVEALRRRAEERLGATRPYSLDTAAALFDEVVSDPNFNENARVRAKLRKLFHGEANSVAELRHDNIVSISDYGDHEGLPFLVMDYIQGRTLDRVIQRNEALSRTRRLRLMEDLCRGLAYAHRRNLVHRDIKPANLIIDSSSGNLKILDFGVVRRLEGSQSTVGVIIGTLCYMSPEQTRGSAELDRRSDIFAVGSVFYELLSGRKAFPPGGSIPELMAKIQKEQPYPIQRLVTDLEPGIESIIARALEKDPARRYQDLSEMERQIARIRARLELEADRGDDTRITATPDESTLYAKRATELRVKDLLQSAASAFATGDDHAVIEFCDEILRLDRGNAEAAALRQRASDRRRSDSIAEYLKEAARLLAAGDLAAAVLEYDRARAIDAEAAAIRAFGQRLATISQQAERARQIAALVQEAREALQASELDRADALASEVVSLDLDSVEGRHLREQIAVAREKAQEFARRAAEQTAARRRAEEDARKAEEKARTKAARERAEDAARKEAERARAEQMAAFVRQARDALDAGELDRAAALASDAAGVDPDGAGLLDLHEQIALARAARRAAEQAADRMLAEAEARQKAERERLEQEDRRRAERERAEEEARQEAERARVRRVAALVQHARAALETGELDRAAAMARDAAHVEPNNAGLQELLEQIALARERARESARQAAEQAAARQRAAEEALAKAERERAEDEARRKAERARAEEEARRNAERERAELDARRQEEARKEEERQSAARTAAVAATIERVQRAIRKGEIESAERTVIDLQRVSPDSPAVVALQTEIADARQTRARMEEAERARRAREEKAQEQKRLAEEARRQAKAEQRREAARQRQLEQQRAAQEEAERTRAAEKRRVEEAEKRRLEEEEAEAKRRLAQQQAEEKRRAEEREAERQRLEAQTMALVSEADRARRAGDYETALTRVREARALAPSDDATAALSGQIVDDARVAFKQNPLDGRLNTFLDRHDPARARRHRVRMAGAIAAVLILALGIGVAIKSYRDWRPAPRVSTIDAGFGNKGGEAPTTIAGPGGTGGNVGPLAGIEPPPPLPVDPELTNVTVDLQPWARVRIIPTQPDPRVPTEALVTPFMVALPPGQYTLDCENGGVTPRLRRPLTVAAGRPQTVSVAMTGFDADRLVDTILGQN